MTRTRSALVAIVLTTAAAVLVTGATSAATGKQHSASQLAGSWMVNVDRAPLPPLKSLQSFTRSHSVIETATTVAVRGPAHGTWQHVSGRRYASTHWFFRFDAQGTYVGTQQINHNLELAADGRTFSGVAISTLRDPAGNVVASGLRATVTGERIEVEAIPE